MFPGLRLSATVSLFLSVCFALTDLVPFGKTGEELQDHRYHIRPARRLLADVEIRPSWPNASSRFVTPSDGLREIRLPATPYLSNREGSTSCSCFLSSTPLLHEPRSSRLFEIVRDVGSFDRLGVLGYDSFTPCNFSRWNFHGTCPRLSERTFENMKM